MSDDTATSNELQRGLGRIEGKLDAVISGMTAHAQEYERFKSLTDRRLRSTEQNQVRYSTVSGVMGAVIGFVANWFVYHTPH